MASLRNLVIGRMPFNGETSIAAACRRLAARPWAALAPDLLPVSIFREKWRQGGPQHAKTAL